MNNIYNQYKNKNWLQWSLWLVGIILLLVGILMLIYNILTYFLPYRRRVRITIKNQKKIEYEKSKQEVKNVRQ